MTEELEMLERISGVMTQDGRTLSQAALAWLWARSAQIIPIPGFKTVQQVEENAGAMEFGSLSDKQIQEIDRILGAVQEPEKFDINSFIAAIRSQNPVSEKEGEE